MTAFNCYGLTQEQVNKYNSEYAESKHNLKKVYKMDNEILELYTFKDLSKKDKIKVQRFVRKYRRETKGMTYKQKLTHAIRTLSYKATYETKRQSVIDILNDNVGNCFAYTKMLKLLLDSVNIESHAEYTRKHIWNVIDGKRYDMTMLYKIYRRF